MDEEHERSPEYRGVARKCKGRIDSVGYIFTKEDKRSNGTFINGERPSSEGLESDSYELKSDDIVVSRLF